MATKKYTVIPRTPIRGIGKTIITEKCQLELNDSEAYRILKAGNQLQTEEGTPVSIDEFAGAKSEQTVLQAGVLSKDNTNGTNIMLRNACKVIGSPSKFKSPLVDLSTKTTTPDKDSSSSTSTPSEPSEDKKESSEDESSKSN